MTGREESGERRAATPLRAHGSVPRAVYYALASNVIVALSKFAAAAWTNSGATLAEAVHSSADCANQILLIRGRRAAASEADELHPLGFGRETHFYAMLVALQFFIVGGLGSMGIGLWHLWRHASLEHAGVAIGVLVISAIVEGSALRASIRSIDKNRRAGGLWRWFHETGQLEVMLSIGEDAAALAGVLVSLAGLGLAAITGKALFDALGSIGVGMVMMATAMLTLREIKSLIVGEAARPRDRGAIRAWLEAGPEIEQIVSLMVLRWSDSFVVAVQARLAEQQSPDDLVRTIGRLEIGLQKALPAARWVFFEPELSEHGEHPA